MSWQAVFYVFGASATLWLPFWLLTDVPKQKLEGTEEQPYTQVRSQVQSVSSEPDAVQSQTGALDMPSTDNEQLLDGAQDGTASEAAAVPRTSEFTQFLSSVGMDAGFIALTQRKEVWAICAAQYCNSWGAYALLNWLPTYFSEQVRHLPGS